MLLKEAVEKNWKLCNVEFCTSEQFEELKCDTSYYFLMKVDGVFKKEREPVMEFLSLLKGGEEAQVSIENMYEVLTLPLNPIDDDGSYIVPYLDAYINIIQTHILRVQKKKVAAVMGILLTLPTSSAAIWVSVATPVLTSGDAVQVNAMLIAGGAAVVGCACHMVGFAVLSFKENGFAGLISQGLGTSMLQIPNIMRHPQLLIPPTVAAAICGPIATGAFKLMCGAGGGGMGTCGFVGIIEAYNASIVQGGMEQWKFWLAIALLFFVAPALICWALGKLMRVKGWIKDGYLKI